MIIAGTGHRPDKLGGYSPEVKQKLLAVALSNLEGVTYIISGMALGWDTALARAAVVKGIPFTAAVPFYGQEKMWPESSQEEYNKLLKAAKDVVYVCDKGYAPWKMQIRNEYMVDHCDLILALWNGTDGGTANCIKYAEKKNKPIINLWDHWNAHVARSH